MKCLNDRYIYILKHKHKVATDGDDVFDTKLIGGFSSEIKALQTIEKYKSIEGFKDYPDGFIIEKIEIDYDDYEFEMR